MFFGFMNVTTDMFRPCVSGHYIIKLHKTKVHFRLYNKFYAFNKRTERVTYFDVVCTVHLIAMCL